MTWIKICGITNLADALQATSLGVNALGFIFAPSPRRINPSVGREIITSLPSSVLKVGVFVDEELTEVQKIADFCGLNTIQIHGRESPEYCRQISLPAIKTIRVRDQRSLEEMERYASVPLLLDAYSDDRAGGTGKTFLWEWALEARKGRNFILAGGLNPGNVLPAIRLLRPLGVDVCSGVERVPGKKDIFKMIEFVKEVKKADEPT